MSEIKKIATRESYGAALVELGQKYGDVVVLDADLADATKILNFGKAFPDRYIDCGIAEANMIGVAAGMSTCGFVPFATSFAMFAVGRAFDQIKSSVGYPHLNVKIVGTNGGVSTGEDGATHQCNDDIALMRTVPGMTLICPCDDLEVRAAVFAAYQHKGPVYIRLGRLPTPVLNDSATYKFELGKGIEMKPGKDVTIVATGMMVAMALESAEVLAAKGIDARVIDIHTIKPIDEEIILKAARETKRLVVAEEHSMIGGLGEAVCSILARECPTSVRLVGMGDEYACSGKGEILLKEFGMSPEKITEKAMELCGK